MKDSDTETGAWCKNLPVLSVARSLEIDVRGTKAMCFGGHDRKTRSLSFNVRQNYWHCFGCGLSGTSVQLVMHVRQLGWGEAVRWCLEHFQGGRTTRGQWAPRPSQQNSLPPEPAVHTPASDDSEIYLSLMELCGLGERGRAYLHSRGFADTTISHFAVGEINDPRGVCGELTKRWGALRLAGAGLLRSPDPYLSTGHSRFLWWDSTILFPFISGRRLVYVQGRRLSERAPKYIGLNGIVKPLYNRDVLRKLKPRSRLFVCEGVPDTIAAYELGRPAVGVLGATSFLDEWALEMLPYEVFVIPDRDHAGRHFARIVQAAFGRHGKIVHALNPGVDKDLAEYLRSRKRLAVEKV